MKDKLSKKVMILVMVSFALTLVFSLSLPAQAGNVTGWGNGNGNVNQVGSAIGLGDQDPRVIAAKVINVILGFLGIIAVVIILLGGFKWMTAGGSEDKIGEAKKLITAGIIGLVIILASWGIATFVLRGLLNATNAPGAPAI